MADYHIDIAYDIFSANPTLTYGVVAVNDSQFGGEDSQLTDLQPNDTIEFYIFDVSSVGTPGTDETTEPSLASNWISTVAADNPNNNPGGATTPFTADSVTALSTATVMSVGSTLSTAFGGPFPAWLVVAQGATAAVPLSATVGTTGTYNYTLSITVNGDDGYEFGPVTFTVDPEMVVDPGD
jgi:hypothetical protein